MVYYKDLRRFCMKMHEHEFDLLNKIVKHKQ